MVEEKGVDFPPLCIFAEGTSSNGATLMPFKRGPFQGMRTMIPCFISFSDSMVLPHYDTVTFAPLVFLLTCSFLPVVCTLNIMPEFTPNKIMLEKHADKGKEPWEIYAWCVRDIISKKADLPKVETSRREK